MNRTMLDELRAELERVDAQWTDTQGKYNRALKAEVGFHKRMDALEEERMALMRLKDVYEAMEQKVGLWKETENEQTAKDEEEATNMEQTRVLEAVVRQSAGGFGQYELVPGETMEWRTLEEWEGHMSREYEWEWADDLDGRIQGQNGGRPYRSRPAGEEAWAYGLIYVEPTSSPD